MAYFHTTVLDEQIKALPTVDTASGSVATFDTDLTENLVECVCDIDNSVSSIAVGYDKNYAYFVDFNQLVKNGNFENTVDWASPSASFTVSNNVCSFVATNNGGGISQNTNLIEHHIYLLKATVKSTTPTNRIRLCANRQVSPYDVTDNYSQSLSDWQELYIFKKPSYSSLYSLRVLDMRNSDFDSIDVKNVTCFDLTQIFGSTLADEIYAMEQQTVGSGLAYFENLFPNDYYDYTASTIETIGTANNDGTGGTFQISFGETVTSGATYEAVSGLLTRSDTTTKKVDNCIIPTNTEINHILCNTGDTTVKYLLSVGKKIS